MISIAVRWYLRYGLELIPSALHTVGPHANNPIEADHGRLKARLQPMRGLKRHRSARVLAAPSASEFVHQNPEKYPAT